MRTLSHYEKLEGSVLLRHDFIKDHNGLGYQGSKLRDTHTLFKKAATPNHEY